MSRSTSGEFVPAVEALRSAHAVRTRTRELLTLAERGELAHFRVRSAHLERTARYVVDVIRSRHAGLDIPRHSRWRHFEAGGVDRWAALVGLPENAKERARAAVDLTVTSVLLDAGAGAAWRYRDADSGELLARSEGLGVASLHLFASGAFSSDASEPLRADATALAACRRERLADAFQVSAKNPIIGLDGRLALLHGLASALRTHPEVFGSDPPRLGHLVDFLAREDGTLSAPRLLEHLLHLFSGIWPGRLKLHGVGLGDVWRHRALRRDDETDRLVPLHKLSQWLCYSLVEALEMSGMEVSELDGLTGLAEYRNGGLLIDLEVLEPRDPAVLAVRHRVDAELIVEWRALTVALLDELAALVRRALGASTVELPLACILEGGTWWAGRAVAAERRANGSPPLIVESDGTVF